MERSRQRPLCTHMSCPAPPSRDWIGRATLLSSPRFRTASISRSAENGSQKHRGLLLRWKTGVFQQNIPPSLGHSYEL